MTEVRICKGTGCISSGAEKIANEFENLGIEVKQSGCHGLCSKGPIAIVDGVFYGDLKVKDVKLIVEDHIKNGKPVDKLLWDHYTKFEEIPFYKKQTRLILRNCGLIDPENIDEYINKDGYKGLRETLTIKPSDVIDSITRSGLRGLGGAGFPTGLKWKIGSEQKSNIKYVIVNADEGDPGAFMDRAILEGDPHSVIEGLIMGGYAIGATQGLIYVRQEYPLAIKRIKKAIDDAKERGFLGSNILDTDFCFEIEIHEGAGAFVCGEETAMIQSITGERGTPQLKPPYPAVKGLSSKPTIINNVKTWSAVSWIMLHGWEEFFKIGNENCHGTAIFSLTGKIKYSGLIEVPMGMTLREIIFDIGGGMEKGKFKAVQTGGPSGGTIPFDMLDTPVGFESMAKIGSIMGSGGMVVIDDSSCIIDFAKFFIDFCVDESCGKCIPCREGTFQLAKLLDQIITGKANEDTLKLLEELSFAIKNTALCGLGTTAPNPVLSTLKYYRTEYIEHLHGICKAGVCKGMYTIQINQDLCNQCGICQRGCPEEGAITGDRKTSFLIINDLCTECNACRLACPKQCIEVVQ